MRYQGRSLRRTGEAANVLWAGIVLPTSTSGAAGRRIRRDSYFFNSFRPIKSQLGETGDWVHARPILFSDEAKLIAATSHCTLGLQDRDRIRVMLQMGARVKNLSVGRDLQQQLGVDIKRGQEVKIGEYTLVYGTRESSNYPLFKHIGMRHGSVQFKTHAGYPVKLYQLWQHWLKAAGADLIIPKTYEAAEKFANKYRVLLDDIRVPVESDMVGGYRVEITVAACNFSVAVGNVQAQLSKEYWSACGLMITEVPTRAVIGACRRGLQEAEPVEILICKSPCTS